MNRAEPPEGLVDVTSLPLPQLFADDSVLAAAVRRLVDELDEPEVIAAFDSYSGGER